MELIKGSEFEEKVLKSDKPVIVDFFATWCGHCKALPPIFEDISASLGEKLHIYKLDIDDPDNMELIQTYQVQAVPTVLFVKGGEVVSKMVGFESRAAVTKAAEDLVK